MHVWHESSKSHLLAIHTYSKSYGVDVKGVLGERGREASVGVLLQLVDFCSSLTRHVTTTGCPRLRFRISKV